MTPVEVVDMDTLMEEQLAVARKARSGRSAITVVGDHTRDLRQTLIAIVAGENLQEHDSPGEATLQVLEGEVVLWMDEREVSMTQGDYVLIPPERHGLTAVTDCAVLLTVATRGERPA